MLQEQERAGIIRADESIETLSGDDIEHVLVNRKIKFDQSASLDEKCQLLS